MKILLLSRYGDLGSTSRYRFYQYLPMLRAQGFVIDVAYLLDNRYLQRLYAGQRVSFRDIARTYARRAFELLRSNRYELLWVEKEVLPWVPARFEALLLRSRVPYVVDYDDAVFHRYDQHHFRIVRWFLGRKIDSVMRHATIVVAGNPYIATRAAAAGAGRVEILPTAVDLARYPLTQPAESRAYTIGWIGSPVTARYLSLVHPALKEVCQESSTQVVLVGSGKVELDGVPLEIKPWSEATEVEEIKRFDVGIMPLWDRPPERGKCGLKLIQYMACARPVVGSPVGVNREIINDGINGFKARQIGEWVQALQALKNDVVMRRQMGSAGRADVEERYCIRVTAPKLARLLREAV